MAHLPNLAVNVDLDEDASAPLDIAAQPEVTQSTAADTIEAGPRQALWVYNDTGGPVNVTVAASKRCSHGHTHTTSVTAVPDTWAGVLFWTLPLDRYGDAVGRAAITYSGGQPKVCALSLSTPTQ